MPNSFRNPYQEARQPLFLPNISGPLELVTAPTRYPVSREEAKAQCRITIDDEDAVTDRYIATATAFCEQEIDGHRQIMQATYDLPVACWWEGPLKLPRPPLSSVTWVKYYDTGGTLQTLSSSVYLVRTPWRLPGTIERAPGQSWPTCQSDRRLPIVIRFVAGYGTVPSAVPQTIRQAVLLLVAHWHNQRGPEISSGAVPKALDFAVRALLATEGWGSYA